MQGLLRVGMLSGFRRGTDWRRTEFVDVIPREWVCSLCGTITGETASLPCSHRLCLLCFQGCRRASLPEDANSFPCVLDGVPVPRGKPVVENHCDAEAVFALKVKCWNYPYGCPVVRPLAKLLDHFEQDCAFHTAICQRCHTPVLLARLPAHYKSGCGDRGENQAEAQRPADNANRHGSPELVHDTLENLESRINEFIEFSKGLDSKSSFLVSRFDEAGELLKALASTGSGTGVRSSIDDSVQALSTSGSDPDLVRTLSEGKRLHDAFSTFRWEFSDFTQRNLDPPQNELFWLMAEGGSEIFQSMPSRTESAQVTRSEDAGDVDHERRALLVSFKKTNKPNTSISASDFLPLHDLLKRGKGPSNPETWTTRLELGNRSCQVKLVVLEENSALDVYGRVKARRRTISPWRIESVRLTHPSERPLLPPDSATCVEPTWKHSRAARLKLLRSRYCFYGSDMFEAMCQGGFVLEDNTVKFRVTLVRE